MYVLFKYFYLKFITCIYIMNFDYSKYKYTQKWFNEKTELKQHLHKYIDPKKKFMYSRNR